MQSTGACAIVLDMLRWGMSIASALVAIAAICLAIVWQSNPFVYPTPWLMLEGSWGHAYSALLGLAFGALVVVITPVMVARLRWIRELHRDLRPIARAMTPAAIVALGLTSAVAEEVLFRGLLLPWAGLVPQAVVFGVAHYLPGRSRWVWSLWAAVVGLVLGSMFQLTGSLAGPVAAHALINGLNLRYLKHHDPEARPRELGGLLSRGLGPRHAR